MTIHVDPATMWAFGVGMVLLRRALFFMIGSDKTEELARLKGEYEVLERCAIQQRT